MNEMDDIDYSMLKDWSLGIVVEDKPDGSDIIVVSPIEQLNMADNGLIKDSEVKRQGKLPDMDGSAVHKEVSSSDYISAKWLPYGHSNRMSAPDVVANETVMIFKYADVAEYFWTTIFREPVLRRLETVLYAFSNISNTKEMFGKAFDKKSSYWIEVSTKLKTITLRTSTNDGEFTGYTFTINTKEGNVKLSDDLGNYVLLDSPSNTISLVSLDVINLKSVNEVNIDTKTTNIRNKVTNITSSDSVNVKTPITNIQGDSVNINANVTMTETLTIGGNVSVGGDLVGNALIASPNNIATSMA